MHTLPPLPKGGLPATGCCVLPGFGTTSTLLDLCADLAGLPCMTQEDVIIPAAKLLQEWEREDGSTSQRKKCIPGWLPAAPTPLASRLLAWVGSQALPASAQVSKMRAASRPPCSCALCLQQSKSSSMRLTGRKLAYLALTSSRGFPKSLASDRLPGRAIWHSREPC
jgi:hypothetical protein